ncbi:MAG: hypothetical protein WED87_04950 [Dehalococcoidia bacterium]
MLEGSGEALGSGVEVSGVPCGVELPPVVGVSLGPDVGVLVAVGVSVGSGVAAVGSSSGSSGILLAGGGT